MIADGRACDEQTAKDNGGDGGGGGLYASIDPPVFAGWDGTYSGPSIGGEGNATGVTWDDSLLQMHQGGSNSLPGFGTKSTGGMNGGDGSGSTLSMVNTQSGNKLTIIPITGWKSRGNTRIDFAVIHNSRPGWSPGPLGVDVYGPYLGSVHWSHSYHIWVQCTTPGGTGSTAILNWSDGLRVPFTYNHTTGSKSYYDPPAGVEGTLYYDSMVTSWYYTTKDQWQYAFFGSTTSYVTNIADQLGNGITIYRTGRQVNSVYDASGRLLSFTYSGGFLRTVGTPDGRTWTFDINGSGVKRGVDKITYPTIGGASPTREFTYYNLPGTYNYCISLEKDLVNSGSYKWACGYDTSGRMIWAKNPIQYAAGGTLNRWDYDYQSTYTKITEPEAYSGATRYYVQHNYTSGAMVSATDEAGYSENYWYDSKRNLTTLQDRRLKTWTWDYTGTGSTGTDLLSFTDPDGETTSYVYTSEHNVQTITDPALKVTTYTYQTSQFGNEVLDHVRRPGQSYDVATYGYDSDGNLQSVTDGLSHSTTYSWSTDGNLTAISSPSGASRLITYEPTNRLWMETLTDPGCNTITVTYDAWKRPLSASQAGYTGTFAVDRDYEGNLLSATDQWGHSWSWGYDQAFRQTGQSDPLGYGDAYTINGCDQVTKVTDANSKDRTYAYAPRGETYTLTMSDGSQELWQYNANSAASSYRNPMLQTTYYYYRDSGETNRLDYPDVGVADVQVYYDSRGRPDYMTDQTGTTDWTFDDVGRLTQLSMPQGVLSYTYNDDDSVYTEAETGVGTTTRLYDGYGRLEYITNPFSETTRYYYQTSPLTDRVRRRDLANGTWETVGYDNKGRLSTLYTWKTGPTMLMGRTIGYDKASRATSVNEVTPTQNVTRGYEYDSANQLTKEYEGTLPSPTWYQYYSYGPTGNRLTRNLNGTTETYSYVHDKLDYVTVGGATVRDYTYDNAGRVTTLDQYSGGSVVDRKVFTWDSQSQMTRMQRTIGASFDESYKYNTLGARVQKSVSGGSNTDYSRKGLSVVAPISTEYVGGSAQTTYTPGTSERRSGVSRWLHSGMKNGDLQTNVLANAISQKRYDAFGDSANTQTFYGGWTGPQKYAGGIGYYADADDRPMQVGHRWYDASSGRFLTRDPARSSANWYVYCGNSPIDSADPTGLVKITCYWYGVLGVGNHYFLVIEDNVPGSKTYGKKWFVSGYPKGGNGVPPDKFPLEAQLEPESSAYDRGNDAPGKKQGGLVLVDDQSPVDPWLVQARGAVDALNAGGYRYSSPGGNNSNTVFYYVLHALGLVDQFEKASDKREKTGRWKPWAPGIGMPRPPLKIGPKPFPKYIE